MKNLQKGFTLVELIVVITILAILGTIAFISLQGYSQDARNSKVTSDIRTLVTAVETSMTDGTINQVDNIVSASAAYDSNEVSGNVASGAVLGTNSDFYDAGTINFVNLRQNGADFTYTDNWNEKQYIVGAVRIAAGTNGLEKGVQMYQIAGLINDAGTATPVVQGNYVPYVEGTDLVGILSANGSTDPLVSGSGWSMGGATSIY